MGATITHIGKAMLNFGMPRRFADTNRIATAFCALLERAEALGQYRAACALLRRLSKSGGKLYAGG